MSSDKSRATIAFTLAVAVACFQAISVTSASAITVELANKCREMSLMAFPPKRIGTKGGSAGEERKYYRDCLANGGPPPDDNSKRPTAAPAR